MVSKLLRKRMRHSSPSTTVTFCSVALKFTVHSHMDKKVKQNYLCTLLFQHTQVCECDKNFHMTTLQYMKFLKMFLAFVLIEIDNTFKIGWKYVAIMEVVWKMCKHFVVKNFHYKTFQYYQTKWINFHLLKCSKFIK